MSISNYYLLMNAIDRMPHNNYDIVHGCTYIAILTIYHCLGYNGSFGRSPVLWLLLCDVTSGIGIPRICL